MSPRLRAVPIRRDERLLAPDCNVGGTRGVVGVGESIYTQPPLACLSLRTLTFDVHVTSYSQNILTILWYVNYPLLEKSENLKCRDAVWWNECLRAV